MSKIKIAEQLEEFGTRLIALVNAHLKYYKIAAYEQVMSALSVLLGKIIILLTLLISSLFASIWLSFFLGKLLKNVGLGFLIVSGIYLLLGWLVFAKRNQWIIDPIIREVSDLIEKQEKENG